MIYLETNSTNPAYNLAFEEWVLTHLTGSEYLILWQNDNTVVVGQNQNTLEEINADFVQKHGVHVVRRTTGGGAVYHDLGNLNFSFITDYDPGAGTDMSRFTHLVVDALASMGVTACASGRNDILVDGKKVSGTAQRIVKVKKDGKTTDRILYHGTLLFRSDPEMIAGSLHADPLKFSSKSTKSVRSRVGNISDYLPAETTLKDFWDALRDTLSKRQIHVTADTAAGQTEDLTEQANDPENTRGNALFIDFEEIRKQQKQKYENYDWTYGRSPAFTFQRKKRFPGGTLELRLQIEKGSINDIAVFGDFLSLEPVNELTKRLQGISFTEEEVKKAMEGIDFSRALGAITKEEFLETMFS